MANNEQSIWLAAGIRTPFVGVDGPFAHRDSLTLSVPVVAAMAERSSGPIDFGVWGAVIPNLGYTNLAREVWLEAGLDPHVPTFTTIMQCSTSMVGVFEAAGMLGHGTLDLAIVGGVDSMSRVQVGLGQNFSDWLRRLVQARNVTDRLKQLIQIHPSDVWLDVPAVKNRVTRRSMGEHTQDMAKDWKITREEQEQLAAHGRSGGDLGRDRRRSIAPAVDAAARPVRRFRDGRSRHLPRRTVDGTGERDPAAARAPRSPLRRHCALGDPRGLLGAGRL